MLNLLMLDMNVNQNVSCSYLLKYSLNKLLFLVKPIDSFPPIRDTLNDIEKNFKNLKALSRAKISSDYSLDNNSLVNSCLDIVRIKVLPILIMTNFF